jgi:hypothetical protein
MWHKPKDPTQFCKLQALGFWLSSSVVMAALALLITLVAPMFLVAEALQPAATCATTPLKFQQAIAKDAFRGGLEPAGEVSLHHYYLIRCSLPEPEQAAAQFVLILFTALAVL